MESRTPKPRYASRSAYKFAQQLNYEIGGHRYFPAAVEYIHRNYEQTQIDNGNRRILHEDDRLAIQAGILSCKLGTVVNPVVIPVQPTKEQAELKSAS